MLAELARLDEGAYRAAVRSYALDAGGADDSDPSDVVWRAELALYLDQLETASELGTLARAQLAEQVAAGGTAGALARDVFGVARDHQAGVGG